MADKNMDITDDVIQRLNTKLPSVTVTIPSPNSAAAEGPAAAQAPAENWCYLMAGVGDVRCDSGYLFFDQVQELFGPLRLEPPHA